MAKRKHRVRVTLTQRLKGVIAALTVLIVGVAVVVGFLLLGARVL